MIVGFVYLGYTVPEPTLECHANSTYNYATDPEYNTKQLAEVHAKNMSVRFKLLLQTGTYIFSVYVLLWLVFYSPCVQDSERARKVLATLLAVATLVYLSHFIGANVIRWTHAGRVCSGDFGDPFEPYDNNDTTAMAVLDS